LLAHASTKIATFVEAIEHTKCQKTLIDEYDSVLANETWNLVDYPPHFRPIGCKWVYQIKYKPNDKIDKYIARLMAKGFIQQEGIDYDETFAPTTNKWNTIKIIYQFGCSNGWKLHQMDVKSAFLSGALKEEVFMTQPEGFEVNGKRI
jgi:hypothetical protein